MTDIYEGIDIPQKKWQGLGIQLQDLMEIFELCLSATDAEERYSARTNPIRVQIQDRDQGYVFNHADIIEGCLVLRLTPEF